MSKKQSGYQLSLEWKLRKVRPYWHIYPYIKSLRKRVSTINSIPKPADFANRMTFRYPAEQLEAISIALHGRSCCSEGVQLMFCRNIPSSSNEDLEPRILFWIGIKNKIICVSWKWNLIQVKRNKFLQEGKYFILIKLFVENFCRKLDTEIHPLVVINLALIRPIHNVKSFTNFSVEMYQNIVVIQSPSKSWCFYNVWLQFAVDVNFEGVSFV